MTTFERDVVIATNQCISFFCGYSASCSVIFQQFLLPILPSKAQSHPQRILKPHAPNFLVKPVTTTHASRHLRVPKLQGWNTCLLSRPNSDGASSSQRSGQNSVERWKFLGSWQEPIIEMPTLT
jgi:hypothetical protein